MIKVGQLYILDIERCIIGRSLLDVKDYFHWKMFYYEKLIVCKKDSEETKYLLCFDALDCKLDKAVQMTLDTVATKNKLNLHWLKDSEVVMGLERHEHNGFFLGLHLAKNILIPYEEDLFLPLYNV